MIESFRHRGLRRFFETGVVTGVRPEHAARLGRVLDRLDTATEIRDMRYPGSRLHRLKGDLVGYWSVRVSGNWRVVFRFANGNANDVDYIDYH